MTAPPLRVLCVDDNRDSAALLAEVMRLTGYEARCGFDGRAGLAEARRFRPDVCVIDINMPGMGGGELARRVRREFESEVLLVGMAGGAGPEPADVADRTAFDRVFVKPTPADELLCVVAAFDIRRSSPRPTPAAA